MKSHDTNEPAAALRRFSTLFASCLAMGILLTCMGRTVHATSLSGTSTTILRGGQGTDNSNLYPLYEYLNFSVYDTSDKGTTSFNAALWGRADLGDRTGTHYTNGDVQYGFLTFQGNRNNLVFSAGRQFINEGVTMDFLDGLYLRSDLGAGFAASAYVGAPATTDPSFVGGDLMYGTRVSHSLPRFYTVGLSFLKDDNGGSLREEEGLDIWVTPIKQVDIVGHSNYNSLTRGWSEHDYVVSVAPISMVRISADFANRNYRDFFHHVTTSALSLTNGILLPQEEVLTVGGSVGITPVNILTVSGDYHYYDYEVAGHAHYFGGQATLALPDNLASGLSVHRMDGGTPRLRYNEYRVFATKKLGRADVTLDFFDVDFDTVVNGSNNTYSFAAALGFDVTGNLRVAGDLDYSKNYFQDNELRGLLKVTYAFDIKSGAEGRTKR